MASRSNLKWHVETVETCLFKVTCEEFISASFSCICCFYITSERNGQFYQYYWCWSGLSIDYDNIWSWCWPLFLISCNPPRQRTQACFPSVCCTGKQPLHYGATHTFQAISESCLEYVPQSGCCHCVGLFMDTANFTGCIYEVWPWNWWRPSWRSSSPPWVQRRCRISSLHLAALLAGAGEIPPGMLEF